MLELKRDAEGGELSEQASGDAPPHISQPHCDDDDFDCETNHDNYDEDGVVAIPPTFSPVVHVGRHL